MKVFGHKISVTTRHVLMLLLEKGQDAQVISIDVFADEQNDASHLARHPFGHIPVLEDGEFRLYETPAILRYIEAKWPNPPLTPDDIRDRARMDQWLCIEQAYLQPAMQKVIARTGARQFGKADPGAEIVEEGRAELSTVLDEMERHLSGQSFLGGERFCLADLVWLAYVPYLIEANAGDLLDARPRVAAWWSRVKDRPSHAATLTRLGVDHE